MKIYIFALLTLLTLLSSNAIAQVKLLSDFNDKLDQAAIVLKAQADLDAQQSNLLAQEALRGWEVFGGVSAGYQKESFCERTFRALF